MHIGINCGYWGAQPPRNVSTMIERADELGVDSVWTSEAYGSDALTPLAWYGSHTTSIRLGTAVMQMSARTPTAAAMAAVTLDHLSNGRFIMGLGVSGPQVVEGWYGQPYGKPLARTREYIDIVRQVFAREQPVSFDGTFYQLPILPDNSARSNITGLGKPLKSTVHPRTPHIPIHLAAEGPKNIALSAEICDGWLPLFYSPRLDDTFRNYLEDGFARREARLPSREKFEICATVPVVFDEDLESALARIRPFFALYIGGMGAQSANFHRAALERLGYKEICDDVVALYQQGSAQSRAQAAETIPLELIDEVALVGPIERIARSLRTWESTAVTSLLVQGDAAAVEAVLHARSSLHDGQ